MTKKDIIIEIKEILWNAEHIKVNFYRTKLHLKTLIIRITEDETKEQKEKERIHDQTCLLCDKTIDDNYYDSKVQTCRDCE